MTTTTRPRRPRNLGPAKINPDLLSLTVPIDWLKPDPDNANDHPEENLAAIAASLEDHGQQKAIVVLDDGTVVAGNGTLEAAKRLGWRGLAAVIFPDRATADDFAVRDNQTNRLSRFNAKLGDKLKAIAATGVDLGRVGFNADALKAIGATVRRETLASLPGTGSAQPDAGEAAPLRDPPMPEGVTRGPRDFTLLVGDCVDHLKAMPADSVDSVVTDPPYGLNEMPEEAVRECLLYWVNGTKWTPSGTGFMGKAWDAWVPGPEVWREVLRVMKPGAHAVVFAGTRTVDLMAIGLRLAGFEVRDCGAWLYGTGFPKSLDVSKAIDAAAGAEREVVGRYQPPNGRPWNLENDVVGGDLGAPAGLRSQHMNITAPATPDAARWSGWGTALKPAQEPWLLVRKPLTGTVAANVLAWGTGGLNIDGARIGTTKDVPWGPRGPTGDFGFGHGGQTGEESGHNPNVGRWPANVILSHSPTCQPGACDPGCAVRVLDEQSGERPAGVAVRRNGSHIGSDVVFGRSEGVPLPDLGYGDSGGASRFFYIAKADGTERDAGLDDLPVLSGGEATDREDGTDGLNSPRAGAGRTGGRRNTHATVKPYDLMRYLCVLVTPPGGVVLDPFTGSGSTGIGALHAGFRFIGTEMDTPYAVIAWKRLSYWAKRLAED